MAAIPSKVRAQFKLVQTAGGAAPPEEAESDANTLELDDAAGSWQEKLLAVLLELDPGQFERLSQRLLREQGFVSVTVTVRSGDGGIDGTGILKMRLLSFQMFFQCKRYHGNVGASAIRDFRGAMVGRTDKGVLITTGRFTAEAIKEANRDGVPPVDLVDGEQLCVMLKELGLGVSTELVEQVRINADWFRSLLP
jgi:restriction system protein